MSRLNSCCANSEAYVAKVGGDEILTPTLLVTGDWKPKSGSWRLETDRYLYLCSFFSARAFLTQSTMAGV